MSYDPKCAFRFAAFAAAMRAQSGVVDLDQLTRLERQAEQLEADHQERRAVTDFVAQTRAARFDPASIEELGRNLSSYIRTLSRPDPVGAERRDLFG